MTKIPLLPYEVKQLNYLLDEQIRKITAQASQHKHAGRENIASMLEHGVKQMEELRSKLRVES